MASPRGGPASAPRWMPSSEDGRRPQFVSLSYGRCYAGPYVSIEMVKDLQRGLEAAALAGVTLMVASGDWGAFSCHPFDKTDHRETTDFPGCSQYALSVGGTMLDAQPGRHLPARDRLGGLPVHRRHRGRLQPGPRAGRAARRAQARLPGGRSRASTNRSRSGTARTCPPWPTAAPATSSSRPMPSRARRRGTWSAAPAHRHHCGPVSWRSSSRGRRPRASSGSGSSTRCCTGSRRRIPDAFHDVVRGGNLVHDSGPGWDAATGVGTPVVSVLADAIIETLRGGG